jgi:hypothetical protein
VKQKRFAEYAGTFLRFAKVGAGSRAEYELALDLNAVASETGSSELSRYALRSFGSSVPLGMTRTSLAVRADRIVTADAFSRGVPEEDEEEEEDEDDEERGEEEDDDEGEGYSE